MKATGRNCCEALRKTIEVHEDFQRKLIVELECPVCRETCRPPIFMCANSHIVCSSCREKITECAICRSPGQPDKKNLFAESASVQLGGPCVNEIYGCKSFVLHNKVVEHETVCKCIYECYNCNFVGSLPGFQKHYITKHPECCTLGDEWKGYILPDRVLSETRYFSVKGDFVRCGYYPDTAGMRLYAESYGPVEVASKYNCMFEFSSIDGAFKCCYRIPFEEIFQGNSLGEANLVHANNVNVLGKRAGQQFQCTIKIQDA